MAIVDRRRAYLQIRVLRIPVALPYCNIWWSKILPREAGVWLECGTQCDEVRNHRSADAGRNSRPCHFISYLDDIFVNEDVISAQFIEKHLSRYGLECKPAERVADGARVLGLDVWGVRGELRWKRNNAFGDIPDTLSRRSIFSFCGKLIGHLPVCAGSGSLRRT